MKRRLVHPGERSLPGSDRSATGLPQSLGYRAAEAGDGVIKTTRPLAVDRETSGWSSRAPLHHHTFRGLMALVVALALRDVNTRYKHSLLGLYWAVINPLLTAMIFAFVFGGILRIPQTDHAPYAVFLVVNLTFWSLFANSLSSATISVTSNTALISKIYFPRIVLPTAAVAARLVDFAFAALAATVLMLVYGVHLHWISVAFALPVVVVMVFSLGCAYISAQLQVFYRDTAQIVAVITMLWMYVSPVMYATHSLPGVVRPWVALNPMTEVLTFAQAVILSGRWPGLSSLASSAAVAIALTVAGALSFKRSERVFGEIM